MFAEVKSYQIRRSMAPEIDLPNNQFFSLIG